MKHSFRILALLALLFASHLALASSSPHYALIIDAGSTGSRLHLFEYTQDTAVPQIKDIFSESVNPGLSSYVDNTTGAGASLKKPIDDALQILKAKQVDIHQVKINVLATAGMRILPEEKQSAIYRNVIAYIQENYDFGSGEVRTITGKMEGLFGWLDVNYLLKNFDGNKDLTQGSIDMGGASTQIVFTTTDKVAVEDLVTLNIGGNHYRVFSKSFLGMGLVEALNYINHQSAATSCYPAHYPLNNQDKGSFNFPVCSNLYTQLIQEHQVKEHVPALHNTHFIAYSGTYFIDHFFELGPSPDKNEFEGRVQNVCSNSWEQMKEKYPKEPEKFLATECSNGVYLSELLYHTYQLQGSQIMIEKQINETNIDWTLGALLYQLVDDSL